MEDGQSRSQLVNQIEQSDTVQKRTVAIIKWYMKARGHLGKDKQEPLAYS
jgi:hypothetical protein